MKKRFAVSLENNYLKLDTLLFETWDEAFELVYFVFKSCSTGENRKDTSFVNFMIRDMKEDYVWDMSKTKNGFLINIQFDYSYSNFPKETVYGWSYKVGTDATPLNWDGHTHLVTLPKRQFLTEKQADSVLKKLLEGETIQYNNKDWEDTWESLVRLDLDE